MLPFPEFVRTRTKYCFMYKGRQLEYVIQLLCAIPYLELELPGLTFWVASNLSFPHDRLVAVLNFNKKEFGQIYPITGSGKRHPILDALHGYKIGSAQIPQKDRNRTYRIYPHASPPITPLTEKQIRILRSNAEAQGYEATDENPGWIIGPENDATYLAAYQGLRVTMVSNGLTDSLFSTLFPHCEIRSC